MPPETTLTDMQCDALAWDKQAGLLPAVVQDADTLRVLMLGYMDRAALQATLATGKVTFYSRSRQCAWVKGETSGNVLTLVGESGYARVSLLAKAKSGMSAPPAAQP